MSALAKLFGARLREERDGKGLIQLEIGSQRFISEVERGNKNLTFAKAEELAGRLHTDAETLLIGAESARLRRQLEIARTALRDLRKEVRSTHAKQRIDNALRETE